MRIEEIASTNAQTLTEDEQTAMRAFCDVAEMAGDKPVTCVENRHCGLFLTREMAEQIGVVDLPCLAVAQDELGNWSALFRHPKTGSLTMSQFLYVEVN